MSLLNFAAALVAVAFLFQGASCQSRINFTIPNLTVFELAPLYKQSNDRIATVNATAPSGVNLTYTIVHVSLPSPKQGASNVAPDPPRPPTWIPSTNNDCYDSARNTSYPRNKFCIEFKTGRIYATVMYFDAPATLEKQSYSLTVRAKMDGLDYYTDLKVTFLLSSLCTYNYEISKLQLLKTCGTKATEWRATEQPPREQIGILVGSDEMIWIISVIPNIMWNATFPMAVRYTASVYNDEVSVPVVYNRIPLQRAMLPIPIPLITDKSSTFYTTLYLSATSSGAPLVLQTDSAAYSVKLEDYCSNSECVAAVNNFKQTLKADGFARCFKELDDTLLEHRYGRCKGSPPHNISVSGSLKLMLPIVPGTVVAKVTAIDPNGGNLVYHIASAASDFAPSVATPSRSSHYDCSTGGRVHFCIDSTNGEIKVTEYTQNWPFPTGTSWHLVVVVATHGYTYRTATASVTIVADDECSAMSNFITAMATSNCLSTVLLEIKSNSILLDTKVDIKLPYLEQKHMDILFDLMLLNVTLPTTATSINISISSNIKMIRHWRVFPSSLYNATSRQGTFRINFQFKRSQTVYVRLYPIAMDSVMPPLRLSPVNIVIQGYSAGDLCSNDTCLRLASQLSKELLQHESEKRTTCVKQPNVLALLSCIDPPIFLEKLHDKITTLSSSSVLLSCNFLTRVEVTMTWFKDNKPVNMSRYEPVNNPMRRRRQLKPRATPYFMFEPKNPEEQGFYYCHIQTEQHSIDSNAAFLFYTDVSTSNVRLQITNKAFAPALTSEFSEERVALQNSIVNSIALPISNMLLGPISASRPRFLIHNVRPGSVVVDGQMFLIANSGTPEEEDSRTPPFILSSDMRVSMFYNLSKIQLSSEDLDVNWERSNLRSSDACGAATTGSAAIKGVFEWPTTAVLTAFEHSCPFNRSAFGPLAIRYCGISQGLVSTWQPVNDSGCPYYSEITQKLQDLAEVRVTSINVDDVVSELYNLTHTSDAITNEMDIAFASDIISNIEKIGPIGNQTIYQLVGVLSSVAGSGIVIVAKSQSRYNSSTRILKDIQSIVNKYPFPEEQDSVVTSSHPYATFAVTFLESQSTSGLSITYENNQYAMSRVTRFESSEVDSSIYLPASTLSAAAAISGLSSSLLQRVTTFSYPNGALFLSPVQMQTIINGEVYPPSSHLDSRVLSAAIGNVTVNNLTDPIVVEFKLSSESRADGPRCVYWDFSIAEGVGGWSQAGCYLASVANSRTVCHCDHLTNFAVLVDADNPSQSKTSNRGLDIITFISIGISIASLALTLISFGIFKSVRRTLPPRILMSLCGALLGVYIVFAIGIEKTSPVNGCRVVAMLLHYFLLATFFWMVTEALNLYLCFVKIVGYYAPRFMVKASIVCWGLPAIVVLISAISNVDNYGNDYNCMVGNMTFYVALLLPVCIILLTNFVVLLLVMRGIRRGAMVGKASQMSLSRQARAAFGCSMLLGLTWVFGVLAVGDLRLLFQWLFCITTGLQGLFIFVFYCVRNQDLVNEWKKLLHIGSQGDGSTSGGSAATRKQLYSKKTSSDEQSGDMLMKQNVRDSPMQ